MVLAPENQTMHKSMLIFFNANLKHSYIQFTTLNLSQNWPNLLIQGSHWSNYDFTIVLKSHCVEIQKSFLNYANLNDT